MNSMIKTLSLDTFILDIVLTNISDPSFWGLPLAFRPRKIGSKAFVRAVKFMEVSKGSVLIMELVNWICK